MEVIAGILIFHNRLPALDCLWTSPVVSYCLFCMASWELYIQWYRPSDRAFVRVRQTYEAISEVVLYSGTCVWQMIAESVLTIGEFSGNHWRVDLCKKFVIICIPRENEPQAELDTRVQTAAF